jgi:hypothetical protein
MTRPAGHVPSGHLDGRALPGHDDRVELAACRLHDAELERAVEELLAEELASRRNGPPTPAPGASAPRSKEARSETLRRCSVCGVEHPPDAFRGGRTTCRSCRSQQDRESARRRKAQADDEEPAPPTASLRPWGATMQTGGWLQSRRDRDDASARRELLAELIEDERAAVLA